MSSDEFKYKVSIAKKGQAVIYDEAFTGLSKRRAMTKANNDLIELIMEMRQLNLFIIIVMPTFFLLETYASMKRSKGLVHVYKKKGKKGFWVYFNSRKAKTLHALGRGDYSYSGKNFPRSKMRGRFLNQYTIDEKKYREKKKENFKNKVGGEKKTTHLSQRNFLIFYIYKELGLSIRDLCSKLESMGVSMSRSQIGQIIKDLKDKEKS